MLIAVKSKRIVVFGEKNIRFGISGVPRWFDHSARRIAVVLSRLCGLQAGVSVLPAVELLYVSSDPAPYERCIVRCCLSGTILHARGSSFWRFVDYSPSPPRPCLYFHPSLPPTSVHPSGRGEEWWAEESGVEWSEGWSDSWSPVRQGETNYPSNESHSSSLHLSFVPFLSSSSTPPREIRRTW